MITTEDVLEVWLAAGRDWEEFNRWIVDKDSKACEGSLLDAAEILEDAYDSHEGANVLRRRAATFRNGNLPTTFEFWEPDGDEHKFSYMSTSLMGREIPGAVIYKSEWAPSGEPELFYDSEVSTDES